MILHRRGRGVVDGDPIALILMIYMVFTLLLWLGQSSTAINPVAGNAAVTASYAQAYTATSWVLWLMLPFGIYMIVDKGFELEGEAEQFIAEEFETRTRPIRIRAEEIGAEIETLPESIPERARLAGGNPERVRATYARAQARLLKLRGRGE